MTIRVYYTIATGAAVSVTDHREGVPNPPAGIDYAEFASADATLETIDMANWVWNPATLDVDPRPTKVTVPRINDLTTHPRFQWFIDNIWSGLTQNQRDQLRAALEDWIGVEVERAEGEGVVIGYNAGDEP